MKKNFAIVLGVALVLVAGSFSMAAMNSKMAYSGAATGSGGDVLYSQLDDPSGSAFTDQTFEAPYAGYDGTGADDFVVTGFGWNISVIATPGSQTNAGSNPFFINQAFYADAAGLPGAILADCDFPGNTDFASAGDGDIVANVDCDAAAGTAWVSQSVRQDFNPFGQHFWATRNAAAGSVAQWKNPGNGFGSGCIDWSPANASCGQTGSDMLFELSGTEGADPSGPVPAVGPFGVALMVLALGGGSAYVLRRRRS
jgi:hypothetical protein